MPFTKSIHILLGAVYFFASWTHAFSPIPHVTIPNVLVGLSFILFWGRKIAIERSAVIRFRPEDIGFLVFIMATLLASIVSSNAKTVNYVFAYLFSFLFLAIFVREMIIEQGLSRMLLRSNLAGVVFVSAFVLAEFFLQMTIQLDIQEYTARRTPANALYFIFPRAYGFSEEPTYLAWYFNTLGPIAITYLWRGCRIGILYKVLMSVSVVLAYALTFSAAGFIFLPTAALIAIFARWVIERPKAVKWQSRRMLVVGIGVLFAFLVLPKNLDLVPNDLPVREFGSGLIEKVTLQQSDEKSRSAQWAADLSTFLTDPILGRGPGYLSSLDRSSSLNLFIFVALEQGIVAVIALFVAYLAVGMRILTLNMQFKTAILTGYCAGVLHLNTMTQHYHQGLWLLIALAYLLHMENSRRPIMD